MKKATCILVVDDDVSILELFSTLLRNEGYEVLEAQTGQRGLQIARERRPDLVLLDVLLPDLNGVEVCRQIKTDAQLCDVFVALFSGSAKSAAEKVGGLEVGADDYIEKTLEFAELKARIQTLVRLHDTTVALRNSERHYRRLLEILPDAVTLVSLKGQVLAANSQMLRVLGHAAEQELLGKSVFEFTPPEEHDRIRADITATLRAGELRNVEYTLLRKDGGRIAVELNVTRTAIVEDGAPAFVTVARDITARKRAEQELRDSETRFRTLFEASPVGTLLEDLEGNILEVNEAQCQMSGYSRDELVGKNAQIFVPSYRRQNLAENIQTLKTCGRLDHEVVNLCKDGSLRDVELRETLCRQPDGRQAILCLATDVSDQKMTQRRLVAQHAVIGVLAEAVTLEEAATKILQCVCDSLDWEAGAIWHIDRPNDLLRCVDVWGSPGLPARDFVSVTRSRTFRMGEGLPGRVWSEAKAVWIPDVLAATNFPRGPVASKSGLRAAFGFPILLQNEVIGIIEFFSRQIREPDMALLEMMSALGGQIGQFIARKRAEDSLRKAEANYRSIFENAMEGIFQTTPEGRYLNVNPTSARMLGYDSPEDLITSITNIGDQLFFDQENRLALRRILQTEGFVRDYETQIIRKDGEVIWVSLNVRLVRDANGKVIYHEGTNQDITRRKQAEEALRQSEVRKSAIMEAALDAIVTIDHDGRIIEFNSAAEGMFGHTRTNVLGREMAAGLIASSLRDWFKRGLDQQFAGAEGPALGNRIEVTGVRSDGSEFPIEFTVTRVELGGAQVFYTVFLRDLTQRKHSEARLTMLAHAVESTAEAICISDLQYRLMFVNQAYQRTYGYTDDEVLGKSSTVFFSPNNPEPLLAEILEQTQRGGWQGDAVARRKDGTELPVFLSTSLIKDLNGESIGQICVAKDITERKRAEARNAAFSTLGRQLSAANTSKEAAQIIVDTADVLFGWDSCHVRLFAPEHDQIVPILAYDLVDGQRAEVQPERKTLEPTPMMRYVMKHGAQLVNEGSPIAKILSPYGDTSRRSGSRMFAPMRRGQSLLGFVSIQSYGSHAYSAEDLSLLEALADHCSGALERIKTAESLLESEQRFRGLFESAPIGIALHDAKGHYFLTNRAYQEMLGYTDEELKRLQVKGVTHPEDIAEGQRSYAELLSGTKDYYRREKRYLGKKGQQVWAESTASAVRDHQGRLSYIISMVDDITKRKLAESQIATLVHAVQSTTEPICITDLNDRFTFINRAFQKTYGYTEAEIIGKTPEILVARHTPLALMTEILQQTRLGGWQGEVMDRRKDGTEFPIFLSTSQIKDEHGRILGLMGVAQDITERRRAEEQIKLLADAVQSTQELICVTDHENRFTFVNRAFLQTYGYEPHEIMGRTPEFLYSAHNPPKLCERVFQETKRGGWDGEVVNRKKDGTELQISLSTSQIKNEAGKIIGLVGVARDISERKRVERQNAAFALLAYRLSAASDIQQASQIIIEVASMLFGWDACYVHLYSEIDDLIIPILTMDTLDGERTLVSPSTFTLSPSPLMRRVMKEGSVLINRLRESQFDENLVPFGNTNRPSASMMYVPVHASESVLGVLSIQSYTTEAYSQRDLQLLQILADHCGAALRRIEVTEALRVAEARYRGIFEDATEGIFQTTPDGRYRSANPALARILGYSSPEELIANVTDIERQTYVVPQKREELKRLLATHSFVQGFEAQRYRKDGRKIWMSVNAHVVSGADGKVLYYEGTNQDITERKLAEEELRGLPQRIIEAQESERLRVARELHDGVNQLLASTKMRLRKVEENIRTLSPASSEIIARCNQLLVRALEENRRIAYNLRPSDLDELGMAAACKNFCKEFQLRNNMAVKSRLARNWPRLAPAVELNLFRIVQEAFNNVEKHAHAKTVRLRLGVLEAELIIEIHDDGRGFDPRAKSSKKQRRGIGITNMCERAAAVRGTCEVVSSAKHGTTITVRVPWKDVK